MKIFKRAVQMVFNHDMLEEQISPPIGRYDQYPAPDTVAVELTFAAFL